jgi:hypothetical protein
MANKRWWHFTFQDRVRHWTVRTFGRTTANDRKERAHRFLEEALELAQASGCDFPETLVLAMYVYRRPVGVFPQEVGGTLVTLAALCAAHSVNMDVAAEAELARCHENSVRIRAKHAAKPRNSPLPGDYPQ